MLIQLRGDKNANWKKHDPVIDYREMVLDLDNDGYKVGNGKKWSEIQPRGQKGSLTGISMDGYLTYFDDVNRITVKTAIKSNGCGFYVQQNNVFGTLYNLPIDRSRINVALNILNNQAYHFSFAETDASTKNVYEIYIDAIKADVAATTFTVLFPNRYTLRKKNSSSDTLVQGNILRLAVDRKYYLKVAMNIVYIYALG